MCHVLLLHFIPVRTFVWRWCMWVHVRPGQSIAVDAWSPWAIDRCGRSVTLGNHLHGQWLLLSVSWCEPYSSGCHQSPVGDWSPWAMGSIAYDHLWITPVLLYSSGYCRLTSVGYGGWMWHFIVRYYVSFNFIIVYGPSGEACVIPLVSKFTNGIFLPLQMADDLPRRAQRCLVTGCRTTFRADGHQ